MMLQINYLKFIQLFAITADWDMVRSGWDYEHKSFLGIPYIVYTKELRK